MAKDLTAPQWKQRIFMVRVLREIGRERAAQDAKWGGPAHDDEHGPGDWRAFIEEHVRKASPRNPRPCGCREAGCPHMRIFTGLSMEKRARFRRQMVRVAALAVAAIEAYDRRFDPDGMPKKEPYQ